MHMHDGYTGECSTQGRFYIRKVLTELYQNNYRMYPGDEDNGEMSAWFLLSSMGLYDHNPGSKDFMLGLPLFEKIEIDISDIPSISSSSPSSPVSVKTEQEGVETRLNKKTLTILTENNSLENVFVESILWNGQELEKQVNSISYDLLSQGGTLTFRLGPTPFDQKLH
jgi:putative alpha-1,2-mannosidase